MTFNLKRIGSVIISLVLSVLRGAGQKPELIVQTGHSAHVNAVALSPDGSILASSSSQDGTIKLWNVATGTQLRSFYGAGGYSLTFNYDGTLIAGGGSDGVIKFWDVSTGVVRTLGGGSNVVSPVAFSHDGKILAGAITKGSFLTSGVPSVTLKLWDVSTGKELRSFPENSVNSIAFSPDGKILAASGLSNTIKLWDISTGKELRTLSGLSFVFSPDGKTLATISNVNFTGPPGAIPNGTIKLWDVSSGKELRTTNPISADYLLGLLAFSSDGKSFATYGGGVVRLWDTSSGRELRSFTGVGSGPFVLSNDWKTLVAVGEGNTIGLWDFTTGKQLRFLTGQFPGIYSLAISGNGKSLASGVGGGVDGMYGTIRIWDLSTNPHVRTLTRTGWVTSVAFSPDGNLLASGTSNWDSCIKFWNVQTGALLGTYGPYSQIFGFSVAFGADWKTLAAGSSDKTIKIWDISTGTLLHNLTGHSEMVTAIVISPDGKTLASGSSDNASTIERKPGAGSNGSVKLWDVQTGTELRTIQSDSGWVYSVAFSPDGKTLATGADKSIKLWDVGTGQNLDTLRGLDGRSLAFSPDGKILASGNSSSTLDLWNISTGTHRRLLAKSFGKLVFSRTNNYLFSSSEDSSITIWDTTLGKEIANLIPLGTQDWIVTTPDGLFDGSSAAYSQLLWRFNNNTFDYAPVEAFYNEFFYPGLLGEIIAGKRPKAPSQISKKDRRQPQLNLRLVDHQSGETVTARNVKVQIDVSEIRADKEHQTNSGVQDVRLFRNGSLVKVWHGDVLKGRHGALLEALITVVAGENRLTAYAFNHDNIKSSDATLTVNGNDSLKRKGVAYIIAVGINEYANSQYNLKYAVEDALDFAEEFKRQQTKLSNYERVEVISLKNHDGTKINILRALSTLSAKIQPEDALIIYFAGHGTAQQNRFYLIPHDLGYRGSRTRLDSLGIRTILTHSISDIELERAVENIDASQMLLVIDACNSGQALEAEEKRRGPMNSKGLAQLAYEKGMYILTAAQSYQAAKEASRLGHGFLTYALVEEGLKTNAADKDPRDGEVLLREWLDFGTERVPQLQQEELDKENQKGRRLERIKFAETDSGSERNLQRPRVFYRRETEPHPLIVAKP